MSKVLVTGASGRIGRMLADRLERSNVEVTTLSGPSKNFPEGADLATQDVGDLSNWLSAERFKTVFHCAGKIKGTPQELFQANVSSTLNLTEAIARMEPANRPTLVCLGSAAEIGVGSPVDSSIDESFACSPQTPYGVSKLCQTEVALAAARFHDIKVLVLRVFNLFWLPEPSDLPVQSWIKQLVKMKTQKDPDVLNVGDLSIRRDFIDTDFLIDSIIALSNNPSAEGLVNLGSGKELLLQDVLNTLCETIGVLPKTQVNMAFIAKNTPRCVRADTRRLESLLGHKIPFDLKASLKRALDAVKG